MESVVIAAMRRTRADGPPPISPSSRAASWSTRSMISDAGPSSAADANGSAPPSARYAAAEIRSRPPASTMSPAIHAPARKRRATATPVWSRGTSRPST